MEEFYTPQEVAKLLKVNARSVYRWIKDGKLRANKIGGDLWRIPKSALEEFIQSKNKTE